MSDEIKDEMRVMYPIILDHAMDVAGQIEAKQKNRSKGKYLTMGKNPNVSIASFKAQSNYYNPSFGKKGSPT